MLTRDKRRRSLIAALAAAASVATLPTFAQSFPDRPVTLVVAYPAGSSTDTVARELAQAMTPILGQPVIVVNKGGAGGVIGTDYVAKAAPDGYTIGFGTSSQLVMNAGVYKVLPFDVDKDLVQIGLVIKAPLVIVAGKRVPPTLQEFVTQAKADPQKFRYGSAGNGSVSHVMSELFLKEAGISVQHIPYRGAAPALADLASGQVDFVVDTLIATKPFVDQGRTHWLGVGGSKRSASQPSVPTFSEQGFVDFDAYSWNSLFATAKTPKATLDRLNAAMNAALPAPAFKARVEQVGGELLGGSSDDAERFARNERAKWLPFIKKSGITAE